MKAKDWKHKIKKELKDSDSYSKSFDAILDSMCFLLEKRDSLMKEFKESGSELIVNSKMNPKLAVMNDLNYDIMLYYRELGMTPRGMNSIIHQESEENQESEEHQEAQKEEKQTSAFDMLLNELLES